MRKNCLNESFQSETGSSRSASANPGSYCQGSSFGFISFGDEIQTQVSLPSLRTRAWFAGPPFSFVTRIRFSSWSSSSGTSLRPTSSK